MISVYGEVVISAEKVTISHFTFPETTMYDGMLEALLWAHERLKAAIVAEQSR